MTFDDFEDDEQEFQKPSSREQQQFQKKPAKPNYNTHDDDEDERPVLKKRPSAPVVDDDDEDDTPSPKVRKVVRSGWGGAEQTKNAESEYASRLKVTDDPQIIKFLDDAPFASWRQHWIERQGQKSFVCLGDECPLCNAGSKASARFAFNVALLSDGEEATLKSFEIGPRVIDQLANFHKSDRTGPLSKHYWAVSRTGKGATTVTNLQMVKAADLEDWKLDPISKDQLAALDSEKYTDDIISIPKRKDLVRIAEEELDA